MRAWVAWMLGIFLIAGAVGRGGVSAEPQAPKRIALLIGNSEYPSDKDRLNRPQIDAIKIQNALLARGFAGLKGDRRPTLRPNVTAAELSALVAALAAEVKSAGPDAIGFFYYAGHGLSDDFQNYIVPIDTPDVQHADAAHRLPIYFLTDTLSQALKPGQPTIVVVIDACRTRTHVGGAAAGAHAPGSGGAHLNQQKPGMLLALSAGIGEQASDSGEYADALERAIGTRGLTISGMFEQVKQEVWQKSQNAQMPVHESGIVKQVCLVSCTGKEELTDPREILNKQGILWTVDAFFDAIRRGDLETTKLFLAGHMATNLPDTSGRTLPIIVSLNEVNADKVVDLLARSGVDLNARYEAWAPMGSHQKTLLERSIEHGNPVVARALLAHKVRLEEPMQTFGQMGVTIQMSVLAAAIYWERFDIATALLDAGADPRAGNYAAYRQAQDTARKKPGTAAQIQALMPRIAPPAMERARMEAAPQIAVDQCVRQILATPTNQLLDEASHFDMFSHLTLGPRECVLAQANISLTVGDGACYRPGFIAGHAQKCCEQTYGVRKH